MNEILFLSGNHLNMQVIEVVHQGDFAARFERVDGACIDYR